MIQMKLMVNDDTNEQIQKSINENTEKKKTQGIEMLWNMKKKKKRNSREGKIQQVDKSENKSTSGVSCHYM